MAKVVILWFNFSSSTQCPNGPVASGMSIYKADLLNTDITKSKNTCNCGYIKSHNVNVTNRRNTYLKIKDIKTFDGQCAMDLKIYVLYRLLEEVITDMYPCNFNFTGSKNIAVYIDGEFDDLLVIEKFKAKLLSHYKFNAPIDMKEINGPPHSDQVNTIPFINIDQDLIERFIKWTESVSIL